MDVAVDIATVPRTPPHLTNQPSISDLNGLRTLELEETMTWDLLMGRWVGHDKIEYIEL
jgi:hypothetical protein